MRWRARRGTFVTLAVAAAILAGGAQTRAGAPAEPREREDTVDEGTLRKAVVARVKDFGHDIRPRDVDLVYLPEGTVPRCRVFRAAYRFRGGPAGVTGVWPEGEPPDMLTGQAMAKAFARWQAEPGGLPDAARVAEVAAVLVGGAGMYEAVLTEADRQKIARREEWRPHVTLPALIETDGRPGVTFWWARHGNLSQLTVRLDGRGGVLTEEKFIRDFL